MSTILVFATTLAQDGGDFGTLMLATKREAPLAMALVLYCLSSGWSVVSLGVFHGDFVCVNQTTHEQVKEVMRVSLFDRGCTRELLGHPLWQGSAKVLRAFDGSFLVAER